MAPPSLSGFSPPGFGVQAHYPVHRAGVAVDVRKYGGLVGDCLDEVIGLGVPLPIQEGFDAQQFLVAELRECCFLLRAATLVRHLRVYAELLAV